MPVKSYLYPAIRVDVVTLEPDQLMLVERGIMDDVLGTIFIAGNIGPADDREWTQPENNVWRPRLSWNTWKTAGGPHETEIQAGPAGAQWVCLSRTRDKGRMVRHLALDGSAAIPAGWGVVVASGTVTIDGQQGAQGNYFKPRDTDKEATGNGDLLLVR